MVEQLNAVKDKVEFILRNYPESRDCDKTLWLYYLSLYHGLKEVFPTEYERVRFKSIILDAPPAESLRRVRQKFQEEGQFIGTKRKKRLEESERVREWSRAKQGARQ